MSVDDAELRKGSVFGFSAYAIWGLFPLYFHALIPAGAWEILAHRIVWTMLVCVAVLAMTRQFGRLRTLMAERRRFGLMCVAALVIAANWVLYVFAVVNDRTSEAALGYYLNPLVTVALGVIVLQERLRRLQWAAVAVGAIACIYLAIDYGQPPWISLALAGSFATYGLVKNRLGASSTALQSLSAETLILTPVAVVALLVITAQDQSTFTGYGAWHTALLVLSGVATAIPLLLFAAAARRVPLTTIGLLQFITPSLQLLCGVLLLHEVVPPSRWIGFGIVWIALMLLTIDTMRAAHERRARRRE